MQPRQREVRGLLREAEDRVLPRLRLDRDCTRGVHGDARRLSQMVQGCQDKGRPGLQEPHAVPQGFGPGSIGWIRSKITTAVPMWLKSPGVNNTYLILPATLAAPRILPMNRQSLSAKHMKPEPAPCLLNPSGLQPYAYRSAGHPDNAGITFSEDSSNCGHLNRWRRDHLLKPDSGPTQWRRPRTGRRLILPPHGAA